MQRLGVAAKAFYRPLITLRDDFDPRGDDYQCDEDENRNKHQHKTSCFTVRNCNKYIGSGGEIRPLKLIGVTLQEIKEKNRAKKGNDGK